MGEWEKELWREAKHHGGEPHEIDIEAGVGWFLRVSPGYPFHKFPDPEYAEKYFRANVARFISCVNAMTGIEDPAATMKEVVEVLTKWAAYDALLRTITGEVLAGGVMPEVDAAYDDCVSCTSALLAKLEQANG